MGTKAELEAVLRATPEDLETLSVYADMLATEGDPLGDLIALELQRPARRPLLLRWLASHLKREPGGDHLNVCDESWIPFLGTPIGEFCRGAAANLTIKSAKVLVDAIAQKPRPFMTRFKLYAGFEGPLVLDARHVEAMPNLVELDLDGDLDLRAFRHPRVKRLFRRSWSCNGLTSWKWSLDLPSCEELTIDAKPWLKSVDASKVAFFGLPKLRVVDVSECEPQFLPKSRRDWSNLDVFGWLNELTWVRRLERLRVPSVRTKQQAKALGKLIASAPAVAIEVVRTYSRCAAGLDLASDKVRFAPPWPWLPDDQVHDHWRYRLTGPAGITVVMSSGAIGDGLARVFDLRDDAFRDDWRTIWRALDACDRKSQELPFGILHRGFAGFSEGDHGSSSSLRDEILALRIAPDQLVTLSAG